jgi:nanoRNase/pAp phosphatase (c-di-AMP/oligoRNAs hydrolase)
MLSLKQQAFDLLSKSQNVLIILPQDQSADSLGAGLALMMLGQELNKKVDLIAQEPINEKLSFLPGLDRIKNDVVSLRDFIISIDTSQKKIRQLRYETKESVLKIYLAGPDKLEQKDIKLEPGPFNYDLIVSIDALELESLGRFYEKYTELFFEKPILNIDHRSANEYYGEVNLIEPTASSSAEIITDFFNSFYPNQITKTISTCLLTGIIEETHSFQKSNTNPQTFSLASLLVTRGAEKEKIIQSLYKTKPFNYLKLWGRLLGRLEYETQRNSAWIDVLPADFQETGCLSSDLFEISNELQDMLPQLNASFILWNDEPDETMALVQSLRFDFLAKLNLELSGSLKNHQGLFKITGADLPSAKNKLKALINSIL